MADLFAQLQDSLRSSYVLEREIGRGGQMSVARDGTKFLGLLTEHEGLQLVVSPNWVVELREKLTAAKKKR